MEGSCVISKTLLGDAFELYKLGPPTFMRCATNSKAGQIVSWRTKNTRSLCIPQLDMEKFNYFESVTFIYPLVYTKP